MFLAEKLKIQRLPHRHLIYLLIFFFFYCPQTRAAQEGIVRAEKAVIYSDREMTSPIGYIKKGKKVTVGEVPRNKAQVYPIVVSGKIAFIKIADIDTQREFDSQELVAERFQKATLHVRRSKLVVSYFNFNSQISMEEQNAAIMDSDAVSWHGFSLKGEGLIGDSWDLQVLMNYMVASVEPEKFTAFEIGFGGAYRLIDKKRFLLRMEGQLLLIPFSSYEVGDDFLKRSYGMTFGAGVSSTYFITQNWGIEASLGLYQTRLLKFESPAPYKEISPIFTGTRFAVGMNFSY